MGRSRLPEHIKRLIPAAERSATKPKATKRQMDQSVNPSLSTAYTDHMTEREFQTHVLALAKRLGWTSWHDGATNAPRVCYACKAPSRGFQRNAKGLPDLILVRGPRLIWAELKSQDGVTKPEQRQWIADLRAAGQTVFVWRPSQWSEIESVLT